MPQGVALGTEPRQRLIVEAGKAVVEERGAAVGEDRHQDLIVGNLTGQQRLPPD